MKLRRIDEDGYIHVSFWSFWKCMVLVQLVMTGIVWTAILLFIFMYTMIM